MDFTPNAREHFNIEHNNEYSHIPNFVASSTFERMADAPATSNPTSPDTIAVLWPIEEKPAQKKAVSDPDYRARLQSAKEEFVLAALDWAGVEQSPNHVFERDAAANHKLEAMYVEAGIGREASEQIMRLNRQSVQSSVYAATFSQTISSKETTTQPAANTNAPRIQISADTTGTNALKSISDMMNMNSARG